ncbi:PRP38-assoc domain containing protein [Pyrenophora tritici-repentis]|uniref:RNA-directed DNA polymerase n=1 Tax=Pyrenophora tritici-repentis TaxID=45151 RepID=A0A834SDA0_9PLEO|nr:PRP38-assoc domain containing protein [Pyrenophora tritici-repentis]
MFRTINAISDNVSTGGRHPRRSSDMQPPPQPSVTDFPIGRKKRKDKAPATPAAKTPAASDLRILHPTPNKLLAKAPLLSMSLFVDPNQAVEAPSATPHFQLQKETAKSPQCCRLQSLRNKNVLSAKITHSEFTFITIVQNETEDEFELYLGRESPLEEFQVPVCTDDDLLELATSNTAFLRSLAIELMKFAAACAPILDANIDAITKEAHEAAVNRLRLRITKAEAKLSWYEKEVSKLTETIETTNAELEHTNRERNELKLEVERFYRPSSSKTAGCTNPTYQDWYEDWKHEEAQSIKFHGLYEEFFRKHQEERARADRYHQQRAERDADYEDVVAQNCALEEQLVQATENTRKLETSLTQQQREYNDVVARLQRYDHNFRPYTLQRREDRGRNSHLSTQRNRRHESPERRTDRRTASPNPYPSRQATPVVTRPAPRPRGDSHSRSRSRSRRDRANPLNQDPHRYIPPPYNGQQSVQQAASTVGGLSLSFKLPDIEVWKGNDDTKNYDKWRRSAIQKCESLPEDKQLAYLEMKVDGAAWQYIDDLKFEHYLDLLEGLDPYYARSTYEKVSEAQSQLADGSLKMGSSESFADWRGRFMSVCRLVKLPDSAMIGYARAFLRPGLAAAASHAFDDEQENALVKFLDAARKSDLTQKQINQGKTAADKPRTKPRTRSPNDRNPARKARSGRGQHREATTTRTEWQKDAMAKAKVCFRCGETGHQARDKKGCAILDWDQIKPKLSSMHLYAMGADFDAEDDDSNASTEEEPDRIQELDWRKDIQQNRETRENHNRLKVAAARILSPEVGDQDNSQDVQDHYISAIAVKGHLRSTKQLRYDSYTLTSSKEWKKTTTLIDTGASASFVNRRWAKAMGLPIMSTSSPIQLSLADGKVVDTLNEAVEIQVKHGSHLSPVVCFVADVGDFDLILGMTWLEDHDPGLTFSPRSMKFSSSHCTSCCLDHGLPETVYGDGKTPSLSESRQTTPVGEICIITAKAAYLMAAHNPDEAIWVEPQDWEKLADPPDDNNDCDLDSFKRNIARLAAVTQEDYDHYMNKMESPHMTEAEIRKLVPDWLYSKMPDLFSPIQAGKLAPHREGVDHEIDTDGRIHKPKIYGLTRTETRAIKAYIDDRLGRGFIRPSTSPYASPVLVVKKPGGGLRICVDYRQLNAITKKNRNAPPSIKETLARMAKVRWMTIVDVVAAFNTVRIKEGDEEKTAFLTRYGLYEYVVMPFGLCNAPGTFQTFINETLREYLDDICTAYLDDVLIYTCDDDESVHEADVIKVLSKIRDAGLHLDPTKCKFKVKKVKYLGLILTTEGIEMDPKKVSTILDWQIPRSVKDVQSFLGFANFYRRFIKGFSYIAKALTELTRKDGEGKDQRHQFPLIADSKAIQAFHRLKDAFKTAGVLAHFDPDLETWLETDASDFVTAAILSQKDATGVLRPVAFLSHKMNPAECNYEIYDKELLAIVNAFEQWRFELSGTDDPIMVLSDHQALQTFMTTKRLNRRQARWAEFMAEFNFIIKYRPGKQGTKPDALTRRPGDLPESPDDIRRRHQLQVVIKPDQVDPEARVCTINIAKDGGSRHAVYLANLITQRTLPDSIPAVAQMLYQLSEEDNISERYAVLAALPGIEPEGGENGVSHDLTSKRSLCAADNVTISPITTPIAATSAPAIPNETPAAINVPAPPNNELTIDALLDNIKAAYKDDKVLQAIVKAKKDGLRRLPFKLIHGEEHLRLELGDCEITDELLYVRNKVYVPAGAVRTQVIEQAHKSVCGGHSGKHELYSKLSRWYYWPRMTTDVAQYVRACLTCKRSKAYREGKHGLLHPLPIPSKYWSSISIDFITHLPPCRHNGQTFTDILVVVDRLTKKKKFIPMASMTTDALVVAFIEYIWREEGFPEEIISDRGAQFVSYFWKRLCQRLGVRPKFSTAHHPQTDGQTENANSYLKQYLRAYHQQHNWQVAFLRD